MKKPVPHLRNALIVFLATASIGASQTRTPGAFVDVRVAPKIALLGQPVMISGQTGYHEKTPAATITVKHESGQPAKTLTANVSKKGEFSVDFTETKKAGTYSVLVTSPDGKGQGKAEFKVTSIGGLADELDRAFRGLDDRAGKLLDQAKDAAVSLPASAERDRIIEMIDDVQEQRRTVDLPPVEILGELRRVVQGPTVVFLPDQKIFGELQGWIDEAEETTDEIDRSKILDRPKESICETMNTAIEGCKFAGYVFSLGKTGLETLKKAFVSKAIPSVVTAAMGDNAAALGVSSSLKLAAARLDGKINMQNSIPGVLLNVVEFGVKHLYGRYCGSYKSPLKVKMTMVWNEHLTPWMKYTVYLEGRMTLRFPLQSAPGKPVPMTGDAEGNVIGHEFWEDVFVVEQLPRTVLLLNRLWLPPPAFPNAVESPVEVGAITRMATPGSFNVPLIAEMTGDKIKIQFKPARMDFSPVMVHRKLLVVFNGVYPDFTVLTVPIQPAFWILSKGFGEPGILDVQKDAAGTRFIAATFPAHRETPDKGVVVDWVISLDSRKKSTSELGGK